MYEEVVAGFTVQLGPAHTETLRTKGNLATLLMEMGEWAQARRLFEEVVAGQTAQFGPAHIDTLRTKANLAILLKHRWGSERRRGGCTRRWWRGRRRSSARPTQTLCGPRPTWRACWMRFGNGRRRLCKARPCSGGKAARTE